MVKRICFSVAVLTFLVALILPAVQPTHRAESYEIIESLHEPVGVIGWDSDGLKLVDGRHLSLPGVAKLPARSEALSQATRNGVEVDRNGRVIGLEKIYYWCGNSMCRRHLARVDLSHLLIYMREVDCDLEGKASARGRDQDVGTRFSEYGWNVSSYFRFCDWEDVAKKEGI